MYVVIFVRIAPNVEQTILFSRTSLITSASPTFPCRTALHYESFAFSKLRKHLSVAASANAKTMRTSNISLRGKRSRPSKVFHIVALVLNYSERPRKSSDMVVSSSKILAIPG